MANLLPSFVLDEASYNNGAAAISSLLNAQSPTHALPAAGIPLQMFTNGSEADASIFDATDQSLSEKIWMLLPGCAKLPRNRTHAIVSQLGVAGSEPASYDLPIHVFNSEQDLKHSILIYVHGDGTYASSFQLSTDQIGDGKDLSLSVRSLKRSKGARDMAKLVESFCHSFRLPDENCINMEALIYTLALTQHMLQVENKDGHLECRSLPFGIKRIMKVNALKNWTEYIERHREDGPIMAGTWCNPPRMLTLLDDHLKSRGYIRCYIFDHAEPNRLGPHAYLFFVDFRDDDFLQAFNHRNFSFEDVAAAAVFCLSHIESFLSQRYTSTLIKVRKPRRDEFLNQTELVTEAFNNDSSDRTKANDSRRKRRQSQKKMRTKYLKLKPQVGDKDNHATSNEKSSDTENLVEPNTCTEPSRSDSPPLSPGPFKHNAALTSSSFITTYSKASTLSGQVSEKQIPREGPGEPDVSRTEPVDKANVSHIKTTNNSKNCTKQASLPQDPLRTFPLSHRKVLPASSGHHQHPRSAVEESGLFEGNQRREEHSTEAKPTYPSYLLFSYASKDRINSCWLPGCQKRTTPFESATTICPRCGINSYVRYCTFDHLLKDLLRHYQYDCGRRPNVLLVDEITRPDSQLPMRPFIYADVQNGAIDTPERHRQAMCHSWFIANLGDYFIFGDLDIMWSLHGFNYIPSKQDIQRYRCTGGIVATVDLPIPADKVKLNNMLEPALRQGAAAGGKWSLDNTTMRPQGQNNPLNGLYLWLKKDLKRQKRWDERMCDQLCFQMQLEFGHVVDEHLR